MTTWRRAVAGVTVAVGALMVGAVCVGCAGGLGGAGVDDEVLVFAAASLSDAFADMEAAFEAAHPGIDLQLNLAGSSGLREQILDGAPASVFASASASVMADVVTADAVEGDPVTFARNSLTVVVPHGNPGNVTGLADFADADLLLGACAVGVPCGDLARTVLSNAGVTPQLDTEEPDVRALLTKVAAGELDAGIVYRTDVVGPAEVVALPIADDVNASTPYQLAVVADAPAPDAARQFVEFVLSTQGQALLTARGFEAP